MAVADDNQRKTGWEIARSFEYLAESPRYKNQNNKMHIQFFAVVENYSIKL